MIRAAHHGRRPRRALAWLAAGVLAAAAGPVSAQTPAPTPTVSVAMDHMALLVLDLDASVAFYADVFGLKEIASASKGRRWMAIGAEVQLHLLAGRTAPVADLRSVHLAFTTDSLDPILAALKARGMSWQDFSGNVGKVNETRSDGVRQIFLKDPDGYWIEVNDARKLARP